MTIPQAELTRFGIRPEDEYPHPYPVTPEHEWWNESVFFDWYDTTGTNAGHCRIGWHPNQQRLWLWLYLWNGAEWVVIEETRLPLSDLALPRIAYDRYGLAFSWIATAPLCAGRLQVTGFGRVVSGRRAGMILPVGIDLAVETVGAAHSVGGSAVVGPADIRYRTDRFEQPIRVRGGVRIGEETRDLVARGERDHSWGPRWWNMEWTVLAVHADALRLMSARVRIPDVTEIAAGYLHRERTCSFTDVRYEFTFDDTQVLKPVSGRVVLTADDGGVLAGGVESITGAEIDLSHTFVPPRRSIYRRALIRFTPDGSAPLLGWVEFNRFPR